MGIAVKAVIWKPDHKNDYVKLTRKRLKGTAFEHGNNRYFIDNEHFQITSETPWWKCGFKRYFITYYFKEGVAKTMPVPEFGKAVKDGGKVVIPAIIDRGVPSAELEALFNPYFLRIIAGTTQNVWDRIQFWATIGTGLAVLYVAWQVNADHNTLMQLKEMLQPATEAVDPASTVSG